MVLSRIAATCVVAAIVTAAASASASYAGGLGPYYPGATPEVLALESEGLQPAAALLAVAVQERLAQAKLAEKVEAGMGSGFGGVWFEAATAKLHIGVTSSASRRAAAAIVAREGLDGDVVLTEVRSTRAELGAAQTRWENKLADLSGIKGKYQTAILPQANAVSVRLSSAVPASTRASLEREASSDSVNISLSVVPEAQVVVIPAVNKTSCNRFRRNEARCNKSITSGVTISNGRFLCTAGPLAIPVANRRARTLLTAGHCGARGEEWKATNREGSASKIGTGETFNFNLEGDYGEIPIELTGAWSFGGATPVFAVTAQWLANEESSWPVRGQKRPRVGETTCHDGQTSGGSCGTILAESVGTNFLLEGTDSKLKVDGLVEVGGPSLVIEPGDSGGPFYFAEGASKTVSMEGITSGVSIGNPKQGVFQPLEPVFSKLNLELLTTANEENRLTAGWMVNGTLLTGTKALATTAAVDQEVELTAGETKVNCAGKTVSSENPVINAATQMGDATSLEFTQCKGNAICPLAVSQREKIKTLSVLLDLTLDGESAAKGRFLPGNSSKLFATLAFEGAECSFAGTNRISGFASFLAPTGQIEKTVQQINVTSEEAGSLKLASTAATLKGSILVRLTSGETFSFL